MEINSLINYEEKSELISLSHAGKGKTILSGNSNMTYGTDNSFGK